MTQSTSTPISETQAAWIDTLTALGAKERGGLVWDEMSDISMVLNRFLAVGGVQAFSSKGDRRTWKSAALVDGSLRVTLEGGEQMTLSPRWMALEHYPSLPSDSHLVLGFQIASTAQSGAVDLPQGGSRTNAKVAGLRGAVSLAKALGVSEQGFLLLCCDGSAWCDLEPAEVRPVAEYVMRRMVREAAPAEAQAA